MDFTMWVVLSRFFLLQRAASKILFKALLESGNALLKASNTERQLSFLPQVRLMTPLPKSIVTGPAEGFPSFRVQHSRVEYISYGASSICPMNSVKLELYIKY